MPADDLATTLAIHRIEGWHPTAEHVEALQAHVRGELGVADCLARFRARHPPPARPPRRLWWRRGVPYLFPGTALLRNTFGVTTADALTELDYLASAARMVGVLGAADAGAPDVRDLHRQLFVDVYAWAGDYRTVDIRRGETGFAWQSTIAERMGAVSAAAATLHAGGPALETPRLAFELARLYAAYNHIHPFRDGNGRTGALLLSLLARRCGRHLDWAVLTREEWYRAAADSAPLHRDGHASHRPFLYPLNAALR